MPPASHVNPLKSLVIVYCVGEGEVLLSPVGLLISAMHASLFSSVKFILFIYLFVYSIFFHTDNDRQIKLQKMVMTLAYMFTQQAEVSSVHTKRSLLNFPLN